MGAAEKAGGEGGEGVEWVCLDLDFGFWGWALCRGVCMGVEFGGISIVLCGHL